VRRGVAWVRGRATDHTAEGSKLGLGDAVGCATKSLAGDYKVVPPPVWIPALPVRSQVPVSSEGELVCVCVVLQLHLPTPYCVYSFLKIELLILAAGGSWLPVSALILPL
jgi:hypothetical protein